MEDRSLSSRLFYFRRMSQSIERDIKSRSGS